MLGQARAVLDARLAAFAAEIDRRSARELGKDGLAQSSGLRSGAELVQQVTGTSRGEAARLVRVGGLLETAQHVAPAAPDADAEPSERSVEYLAGLSGSWEAPVAVAVRNGWLSAADGDALVTALGTPPGPQHAPLWRDAVLELVQAAWESGWRAEELARAARRLRASLDARTAQADAHARFEARSLKRAERADGMIRYDLLLDPESDQRFWAPLTLRLGPRTGGPRFRDAAEIQRAKELELDPRSNEQLLVDEFLTLFTTGVNASPHEVFGDHDTTVTLTLTPADLTRARTAQNVLARHHTGDHTHCPTPAGTFGQHPCPGGTGGADGSGHAADHGPGHGRPGPRARHDTGHGTTATGSRACPGPEVGLAWLDGVPDPVPATTALAGLCAGVFTTLLLDPDGKALDAGRDQRVFTRLQRRALAARDGGCLFPGCSRPPSGCEAHHINPWSESIQNHKTETKDGVLLCRYHHLSLHNHGARITRHNTTYTLHWPGQPPLTLHHKSGIRTHLETQTPQTRNDTG